MYYTELLPRLNSLSVVLDFSEDVKDITALRIEDHDLLINTVLQSYRIKLPMEKNSRLNDLNISSLKCTDLCLRIALLFPASTASDHTQSFMDFNASDIQKWSCSYLKKTPQNSEKRNMFYFGCAACDKNIIDSESCKFFDMPSELWSEMMDFWHCHKPHDHGDHNEHQHTNKYEKLKPKDMEVIIGGYYLLVDKAGEIKVTGEQVCCPSCNASLGVLEGSNSKKLFKYNLTLNYNNQVENFPPVLHAYNSLLDRINLTACRKFNLKSDSHSVYIWVLNIGLDITTESGYFKNALKLLYDVDGNQEHDDNTEAVQLSNTVVSDCINRLREATKQLPSGHHTEAVGGHNWSVGFIASN